MSQVSIVGAYNTPFGVFVKRDKETGTVEDTRSIYELMTEAGSGALRDAGLDASDVDGVWVGSCSPSMMANQEHLAPVAMEVDPQGLLYKPMTRTECACASSSVALYDAIYAVESGRCQVALVIGVEKMNLLDTAGVTHALACSSFWPEEGAHGMTFPGLFAELAKAYQSHFGLSDEQFRAMLAHVSALNYSNGAKNPLAQFGPGGLPEKRGLLTAQAILDLPTEGKGANVMVAPPLRLHDCSLISDGAAALVVTRTDRAKSINNQVVEIAGIGHAEDRMPLSRRAALHELAAGRHAVEKAFREAGVTVRDLDLVEVHDCFTIAELLCAEALGLSAPGRAGFDIMEGRFTVDDDCPINLSGGLKSKGHPVGATGASMHVMLYKQLMGDPIGLAARGEPAIAATLNVGGSGVTNCSTVLRRLQ